MKMIFSFIFFLFMAFSAISQQLIQKRLKISDAKTTFLIFDDKVDYFDIGSGDIGLKHTEKKNIIKLKAITTNFRETNLTVMTSNGHYYSFLLNYSANPDTLNYFLKNASSTTAIKYTEQSSTQNKKEVLLSPLKSTTSNILKSNTKSFITGTKQYKIVFLVKNIFAKEDKLFIHTEVSNESNIDYDVDFLKFTLKNTKRYKKTVDQEVELTPIFASNEGYISIKANNRSVQKVFVFEKFTVPEKKELIVDLWEKNGERNLTVALNGKHILNAEIIKD